MIQQFRHEPETSIKMQNNSKAAATRNTDPLLLRLVFRGCDYWLLVQCGLTSQVDPM